jgi:hypothetical protein
VLAVALTLTAVRRGTLPTGACGLPAARYALPVSVALGTAFASSRPPALEHTLLGRVCGVAQAALLGCCLAPRRWQPPDGSWRPLLAITAVLSVVSGVTQILRLVQPVRRER